MREDTKNIEKANPEFGISGVGIEIVNSKCQIDCGHCISERNNIKYMKDGIGKEIAIKRRYSSNMTFEQVADIVDQSIEIGASEVYFIGAGETTLHPQLPEILTYTRDNFKEKKGEIPTMVVATNGIKLANERYCKRLVETDAMIFPHFYVLGTGEEEVRILSQVIRESEDYTKKNVIFQQEQGRENLMKFSRERYGDLSKVAFDHVLVPPTVRSGQTKKVFEYCLDLGIEVENLFFEMARTSCGVQRDSKYLLPLDEFKKIFDELYNLIPEGQRNPMTPPRVNANCTMVKTGVHIITSGDVLPCCGTYIEMGNVFKTPLKEILKSPVRDVFRNIERYREGHCTKCEYFPKDCPGLCQGDIFQTFNCLFPSSPYCIKIKENLTSKDTCGDLNCGGCVFEDYKGCGNKNEITLSSPNDGNPYKIKGILKGGN